ncbi:sigma 54 modulation/S30EA ribosomal C-terminal domain-containing protein [Kribbella sp. NBC_00709]|uniref:sigma 54 modulation/S30EA ribosomal C-terminal domain-containing protein n=1 Tax=Kribbella sp. NBC_00709 TaxID=2975972 RepID=UPI002E2D5628|nr:sigma 54 modulation/S30EA ribosomal C-terminal domain-containing protein [Kribbella sp. NBC_00709]
MSTEGRFAVPLRPTATIPVGTAGILPTDAAALIRNRLRPILGSLAPHSRVRLTRLTEAGLIRPLVAQADVQLAGDRRVRAQVAAATMSELVGLLATRTIGQLHTYPEALAECLRERVITLPPPSPPELLPPAVRRVARRKVCRPMAMTAAEAIVALEAMDYRFHLFREKYSRQDSIVIRSGAGRYRIIQARPNPIGLEITSPPIVLASAERRSVAIARSRLDLTGGPVEIFTDKATGLLTALYARYDGHYGLLGAEVAIKSARRSW